MAPDLASGQTQTIDCSYTTTGADFPSRANTATVDTDQTSPVASNQTTVPVGFPLTAVDAVTVGQSHTCALLESATVKCWGFGGNGQLGQDSTTNLGDQAGEMATLPAINLGAGRTATAIAAGQSHTCALLDDATVKCWGDGGNGRLGQDSTTNLGDQAGEMATLPAINLGAGRTATAVDAGSEAGHTCAVLDDATLKCWGSGSRGQLGQGSTSDLGDSAGEMAALPAISFGVGPGPASLNVELTADQTTVAVGDPIDYHLTITNTAIAPLSGITVSDPLAPECVQSVPNLAFGADHTIDCTHTATAFDLGTYANTATVDTSQTAPVDSNTVNVSVTIPAGYGLVTGTVTETGSGTPIPGAVAALLSTADFSPVAISITTASGNHAAVAPAGSYYLYALDPTVDHTAGFHGAPTAVAVTAGNTSSSSNVSLASTRGTIAGTVTDATTTNPIPGTMVMNMDLTHGGRPGAGDLTDGAGAFSIGGLTPGARLVEYVDISGAHTPEFFDDSISPAGATTVAVTGAATATATASLAPRTAPGTSAHLVGDLTSTTGGPIEGAAVFAVHSASFSLAAGDLTDAAGRYDIALDPGTYELAFYDPTGDHLFEWHDNQPSSAMTSATTVPATAGTPLVTDAALTPTTGTATGTVTETGSGDQLAAMFVLAIDANGNVDGAAVTQPDGTYSLAGIPAGNHRIRFVDLSSDHVAEYFDNSPDYFAATPVSITSGVTTPNINAALALTS